MFIKILNENGKVNSSLSVPDFIFNRIYNEKLVHQIIVSYKANARKASRKQKNRSEVSHSTRKPWKQKGTGKARAGMSSSPLWRGGGRAFPSFTYENFTCKINKKMYRLCICVILSQLIREDRLFVVENFNIKSYKTKYFLNKFKNMKLNSTLIVLENLTKEIVLASRNIFNIFVVETYKINPVLLIFYKKILLSKESLLKIRKWLLI